MGTSLILFWFLHLEEPCRHAQNIQRSQVSIYNLVSPFWRVEGIGRFWRKDRGNSETICWVWFFKNGEVGTFLVFSERKQIKSRKIQWNSISKQGQVVWRNSSGSLWLHAENMDFWDSNESAKEDIKAERTVERI